MERRRGLGVSRLQSRRSTPCVSSNRRNSGHGRTPRATASRSDVSALADTSMSARISSRAHSSGDVAASATRRSSPSDRRSSGSSCRHRARLLRAGDCSRRTTDECPADRRGPSVRAQAVAGSWRLHEQAVLAVADQLRHAADRRGDDGESARERFRDSERCAVAARGQHEDVGAPEQVGDERRVRGDAGVDPHREARMAPPRRS